MQSLRNPQSHSHSHNQAETPNPPITPPSTRPSHLQVGVSLLRHHARLPIHSTHTKRHFTMLYTHSQPETKRMNHCMTRLYVIVRIIVKIACRATVFLSLRYGACKHTRQRVKHVRNAPPSNVNGIRGRRRIVCGWSTRCLLCGPRRRGGSVVRAALYFFLNLYVFVCWATAQMCVCDHRSLLHQAERERERVVSSMYVLCFHIALWQKILGLLFGGADD